MTNRGFILILDPGWTMHRCRHDIERSILALCAGRPTSISEIYHKFSESGPPLKYSDIKRHISIMLELHWITPVDLENLASLELPKNIGASKGTEFQFKLTGYH